MAVPALGLCFGGVSVMAETEAGSAVLEDITVTANKMEEDIQRVPQSISVIDENDIEEKGLRNAFEVLDQIPNTLSTPNHGSGVNFRGLNPSMFTSNNPVVIYMLTGFLLLIAGDMISLLLMWRALKSCGGLRGPCMARMPLARWLM